MIVRSFTCRNGGSPGCRSEPAVPTPLPRPPNPVRRFVKTQRPCRGHLRDLLPLISPTPTDENQAGLSDYKASDCAALRWTRVNPLVPVLRVTISVSLVLLAMQLVEKLFVSSVSQAREVVRPIEEMLETGSSVFSMVLVQIAIHNEKEVS